MQQLLKKSFAFGTREEIKAEKFTEFLKTVQDLQSKIQKLSVIEHHEIMTDFLHSLPDKPPQPPAENPR